MKAGRPTGIRRFGLAVMASAILWGCQPASEEGAVEGRAEGGAAQTAGATLHYFTWSDYVDRSLLAEFERRTGARVVVDTFSSNEELLAKLQGGASGYDVATPSDFTVSIMARQGLLAELDLERISNAALLDERLRRLPFDPDHRHSIPYLWGTVGIGYDSERVPTPPESWDVLWDPRYKGQISMLNDQREVFGVALVSLGHSLNAREPRIIQEAKAALIKQKPLVKTYTSENYDQLLVSGEVVLAHGWGGAVARAMRERPSIRYVVPREGGTIWTDCLVVLKTSRHQDLAMEFINFLLDTKVAAQTTNRLMFASANREATRLVVASVRDNPAVYPSEEVFSRLEWMTDVGEAIRLYDRAWTELKMH